MDLFILLNAHLHFTMRQKNQNHSKQFAEKLRPPHTGSPSMHLLLSLPLPTYNPQGPAR